MTVDNDCAPVGERHVGTDEVAESNTTTFAVGGRGHIERSQHLSALRRHLEEVSDLKSAAGVLSWDQAIYMPPGGAPMRGRQAARLASLAHKKATELDMGRLLDRLEPLVADLPDDDIDASLVRVARRDYDRAVREPAEFVARVAEHGSASYQAWVAARPANDFTRMVPYLQRSIELSREYAGFFPGSEHIMDPLLGPDEGYTTRQIRQLFRELQSRLGPLVGDILAAQPVDDSCMRLTYPADRQIEFATKVAADLGYDLQRGRIDISPHPFCTSFARDDVRITTRVKLNDLSDALFSTIHEVGHALYEMGIGAELDGTPLGRGASAGLHESQSRLWENIIARSRTFWEHYYPKLQATFPGQLNRISLDTFHRAINRVQRSVIRTDADEVTYNLHIMVRFELEIDMLEGRLAAKDLPAAWDERNVATVGVVSPSHTDGILQDVHWFSGMVGGQFQGYTIGNILSAQLYEAAVADRPGLMQEVGRGEFSILRGWLRDRLHHHGRKFDGRTLVRRVLGQDLSIDSYMRYLERKYGDLYGLKLPAPQNGSGRPVPPGTTRH